MALVIQPLRFQFFTQDVIPFFRYSESVTTSTSQVSLSVSSPRTAAVSSIRLFVVCGSLPNISREMSL